MSNNSTFVTTITSIASLFSLSINFITATAGIIGGLCNLITFTAPKIRQNSCVFYLLCATIFQLLSIIIIIPTRIALDNFGFNLENESASFCKFRYYCALSLPALVTYYMLFAIIDRCLVTSSDANVRAWGQLKIAHRSSIVLCFTILLLTSHALVFYNIYNNTCLVPSTGAYAIIFSIYLAFFIIALPYTLMLVFSLITFSNLKQTRQRIQPMLSDAANPRARRFESQLVKVFRLHFEKIFIDLILLFSLQIIVVQVALSSVLVSLRLGSYIYQLFSSTNLSKTPESRALEMLFFRLGFSLYYFSFAISFYTSTLTSQFFREIFWKRLLNFVRSVFNIIKNN